MADILDELFNKEVVARLGEPITTKYAGDIAYLTAASIRQGAPFKLHEALEQTAWFL